MSVCACVCRKYCRTIPLPGLDKWGFKIGTAQFFAVPRDPPNTFNSYKPDGRKPDPWFMSEAYQRYRMANAAQMVSDQAYTAPPTPASRRQSRTSPASGLVPAGRDQDRVKTPPMTVPVSPTESIKEGAEVSACEVHIHK